MQLRSNVLSAAPSQDLHEEPRVASHVLGKQTHILLHKGNLFHSPHLCGKAFLPNRNCSGGRWKNRIREFTPSCLLFWACIDFFKICLPGATYFCNHMEGKGTSLRKLIANKRWKGKPFQLLEAIHLLKEVTMIHCWGHQNVLTLVSP